MNYLITITLSFLLFTTANAQGLSAGLRTGIGNTLDITQLRAGTIDRTWDKEIFARYETKGRFAFEAGATQYQFSHFETPYAFENCWPSPELPTTEYIGTNYNYNMIDIVFSAQYDITCSYMREKCPIMNNLRSFIGVNAGASYATITNTVSERQLVDNATITSETKNKAFGNFQVGLSHTMIYSFKKLYITTSASYVLFPYTLSALYIDESPVQNTKLSLRAGIGYRF